MTSWPTVVELVGQTGQWDYVEFVAEYAPWTLPDLDNLARGACVVALMIEKREAVENLEAILAAPGVDMIQFGPGDYSLSLGIPGQRTHDSVREAEAHVIETAQRAGVAVRAELRDAAGVE